MSTLALVLALTLGWFATRSGPLQPGTSQSVIPLPSGYQIALAGLAPSRVGRPSVVLSPVGGLLAFVAERDGVSQLFLRHLDEVEARALPGTEGAFGPFFSPDGEWIGFFTATELKKISVREGSPSTLSPVEYPVGATWGEDWTIIFSQTEGATLSRVSADDGMAQPDVDLAGTNLVWPQFLPGGQHILGTSYSDALHSIVVLALETGDQTVLIERGGAAQYVASGHIVWAGESGVMAQSFDLERLEMRGTAEPVLNDVRREGYLGASQFSVSDDGTLVYVSGPDLGVTTPVWFSPRDSTETSIPIPPARYGTMDLSPDGTSLAIEIYGTGSDIWVYDFTGGGAPRQLTFGDDFGYPIWEPDGGGVAFVSNPGVGGSVSRSIFRQSIDPDTPDRLIGPHEGPLYPEYWSPDGVFVFNATSPETKSDVWLLMPGSSESVAFLENSWDEWGGRISPDGKLMAYQSNQTLESQVWVTDYPGKTEHILISTNLGLGKEPIWSESGDELYFSSGGQFYSVRVRSEGELNEDSVDPPEFMFEGPYATVGGKDFDVAPDGRFFLLKEPEQPPPTDIKLIVNFFDVLRERVGN